MRLDAARDEAQASNQQHENHDRVEKARRLEEDMQVGQDARKDEQRAGNGKNPSQDATPPPEKQANAE